VTIAGQSRAYPLKSIFAARLIQDQVAGVSILIVVGPDKESIRVFQARLAETRMTFLPVPGGSPTPVTVMQDAETSGNWNFEGCAISGLSTGTCLAPVDANKDYWFDWMNHHPNTTVFKS
jgi:hypothetical protein